MTKPELNDRLRAGWRIYNGNLFPPIPIGGGASLPCPEWLAQGCMFIGANPLDPLKPVDYSASKGWMGKAWHFKRFAQCLWGDPDDEGFFEWNPNAEKMLDLALQHNFLAIAGCASSSKSFFLGLWSVAMFILRPTQSKVLVTSMTIQTAEGKVWGCIKKFWRRACRVVELRHPQTGEVMIEGEKILQGKLLDSMHIIRRRGRDNTLHSTEGIELIPAEAGEFKKSASKMQGYKSGYVYLLADELATLAPNILETAKENLFSNDHFQLIGAFNPDSHYDPGGLLSEPRDGWGSVDEHSMEWPTRMGNGWCVRFDGTQSPNVIAGERLWRGLMTAEKLQGFRDLHPEKSVGFWKMVRGYWSPTGSIDSIYSESEFESNGCRRPVAAWVGKPVMVAGFDPAWTSGGDKAAAVFGRVGEAVLPEAGGKAMIVFEHVETCIFDEEVGLKDLDKSAQIAKQFAAKCRQHGVATADVALDITGGHAFATVLALEIGRGFMAINFGGAASDLPMPKPDKRKCREAFRDMMSELWYSSKPLVRQGRLRSVPPDIIREACARSYGESSGRIAVEPKDKMRKRTGRSPDRADAMWLSVFVGRRRHGLAGAERFPMAPQSTERALPAIANGNPSHPLADLLAWGRKPKKTYLEEPVKAIGGGWGD